MQKQYEYSASNGIPSGWDITEYLNALGKKGWELVSSDNNKYIFKRERVPVVPHEKKCKCTFCLIKKDLLKKRAGAKAR